MTQSSRKFAPFHVIWQALRTWYDDWFNLFILNFLVTISWATIIFGPPMLFGLFEIGNGLAHGRSEGAGELLRAAKRHFLASWLWMLANLVVLIVIWGNIGFYWNLGRTWSIILVSIFFFLGLLWAMIQVYVIAYYMEQSKQSIVLAHKNAALTFLAAPGYTFILFLYDVILLTISFTIILPLILAAPTLAVVTSSYAVIERLRAFGIRGEQAP